MPEEKENREDQVLDSNDLAFERTMLAENRTLMAWIRTAVSLISFGFTIYKFFHDTEGPSHHAFSPRKVGMLMISIGNLALFWGMLDHRSVMRRLRQSYPRIRRTNTVWLAIIVFIFGLLLLFAAAARQ